MKMDVPDHDSKEPDHGLLLEKHQIRLLDAEATWMENLNREADQRHSHRSGVLWLSIVIVVIMVALLAIVACSLVFEGKSDLQPSVQLAAYVAPITSTTVITIALLFGAFRGYRDRDEKTAASGMSEILRGSVGAS